MPRTAPPLQSRSTEKGSALLRRGGLALRSAIRRAGWDVTHYSTRSNEDAYLAQIIRELGIAHVIDVGANTGQFGTKVRGVLEFSGRLDSYEPAAQTFQALSRTAGSDPQWFVHSVALGAEPEARVLHTYASSDLNSFSGPAPGATELWDVDWAAIDEVVEIRALDDEGLPDLGPTLLKLDTQGHDWQVLDGASDTLDRVSVIVMELSFISLYESSRPAWEVFRRLNSAGFGLAQLVPITRPTHDHRILEADGVFVRQPLP